MSDWELVTGLLAEATERPGTGRREWLHATGHPPAVIAEVARLLDAWEADPHYLEIDLPLPETLGPWRIGRELGAGGMGRVYEAFHCDPTMERRVAIKVIGGRRFAPELVDSFLRERAILARLEHPHIARLYDTGATPQGLPFFAMEFVDGLPIDRYVETRKPAARERIALLRKVCSAIGFAHRNLIVHGDIKPNNILVTADGEPRVLDFGIGRMLNTAADEAAPMLTPSHASPEQLAGEPVNTTSDIYQLGLLLRLVAEGGNAELDAVIAKCLRPEPELRYPTAEALERELDGWLRHMPLTAVAPRWGYRAKKFIRRHPLATALAAAVLLGTATTGWQARRANLNRERTLHQFEQTRAFSRAMLRTIAGLPVTARKPIVQSTVELLTNFDQTQEQDPVLLLELAYAWRALGAVQGLPTTANLGEADAAIASYEKAIALGERARNGNERDALIALCTYYAEAARVNVVRGDSGRMAELAAKLTAAVQALERYGPNTDVAIAYSEIAFLRSRTDRQGAMEAYRRAVDQFDRTPGSDQAQKAYALKRWGALLLAGKQFAEGGEKYKSALAIERRIQASPFDMSFTLSDLGLAERQQKRLPEALAYYEEALAIREAAYKADPKDIRAVMGLASTLDYMAWVHADAGRTAAAVMAARRALEYATRAATTPKDTAFSRRRLVRVQISMAEFLRRQDAKRHAAEVQALINAVRQAIEREPDENLTEELRAFLRVTP